MFKNSVMMNLKDLNDEIFKSISTIYKNLDISATPVQGRIMLGINNTSRPLYQKDIEEYFGIRRSSVSSVLDKLEKSSFITRKSCEKDARLKKIELTEEGIKMRNLIYGSITKVEDKLHNSLSDEELNFFLDILSRLSKEIDD